MKPWLSLNLIILSDCEVNSTMMDKISLQQESESLISCTCSIFINVKGSRSSIALQALRLWLGTVFDTNEASELP